MHRPRIDMYMPCDREDGDFRWGSMEGANDGFFAIRTKSDIITWPRDANGNWTGRREVPDAAAERFDLVVRQGTAGIQMRQTERFQAERGLSPAAYIGGTVEEMKRLPAKNPQPGFGGDSPEFADRGKGGDKPEFADLMTGKCKGRTSREQITFYRNVGNQGLQFSAVGGWVYSQAVRLGKGREIPTAWFLQDIRD